MAGCYYVFFAGSGWNRTGLGIAFYDDNGSLVTQRFDGVESAIRRGDLPDTAIARTIGCVPAQTKDAMDKRLDNLSNAMSVARWEGPWPTVVWDDDITDRVYTHVIGQGEWKV